MLWPDPTLGALLPAGASTLDEADCEHESDNDVVPNVLRDIML